MKIVLMRLLIRMMQRPCPIKLLNSFEVRAHLIPQDSCGNYSVLYMIFCFCFFVEFVNTVENSELIGRLEFLRYENIQFHLMSLYVCELRGK